MNETDRMIMNGTLADYERYNQGIDGYSEARPYNLSVMEKWIKIRDKYTMVDDYTSGNWQTIDIKQYHSKYGTNYLFVDNDRMICRTRTNASEFYGSIPSMFQF